jgi:hypothetical protein
MLCLVMPASAWASTAKPQARIGELLVTAQTIEDVGELEDGSKPRLGFHFVIVTGAIANVGKHALCGHISAVLETTFNLQSYATVHLNGRYTGLIDQMLPGEHSNADFVFNVKDGVQPTTLVVKQGRYQGCSAKERLPLSNPQARISIEGIDRK